MRSIAVSAVLGFLLPAVLLQAGEQSLHKTSVRIREGSFEINGRPTYAGRQFHGWKIEGLLMNSRMVQGIFDDRNPETRGRWDYPDAPWDPERNTREFVAAMPVWRAHGLLSFAINLQGGSPEGYSKSQPWKNSAFESNGSLRQEFLARLATILDKADELGMAPIVGFFYFGQAGGFESEAALVKATENATDWLLSNGWKNVLVEIANECNHGGYPAILQPPRAHELLDLVRQRSGGRLLVSTSLTGGRVPTANLVQAADFILLHGNGVREPDRLRKMVDDCRAVASYRGQPILFNEDDHYDFEKEDNNFLAAVSRGASWGYFDFRRKGEGYEEGYQSVPVNWGISSERKRGFFELLKKITGEN